MENQWLFPGQPVVQVAKQERFSHKIMMCVWRNFEGILHFELVPNGHAVHVELYSEQLERLHNVLRVCYLALINRKRALLQHDNAPAYRSGLVKQKNLKLAGIEMLPHPGYSPELRGGRERVPRVLGCGAELLRNSTSGKTMATDNRS